MDYITFHCSAQDKGPVLVCSSIDYYVYVIRGQIIIVLGRYYDAQFKYWWSTLNIDNNLFKFMNCENQFRLNDNIRYVRISEIWIVKIFFVFSGERMASYFVKSTMIELIKNYEIYSDAKMEDLQISYDNSVRLPSKCDVRIAKKIWATHDMWKNIFLLI